MNDKILIFVLSRIIVKSKRSKHTEMYTFKFHLCIPLDTYEIRCNMNTHNIKFYQKQSIRISFSYIYLLK